MYIYIYTHIALFVQYNTIALNAEVIGALHTLKMKAIKSESCIRKKQVAYFLVISFVAWVPNTETPFCFLPGACKSMLYFISAQSHYGHLSISTEVLHLLLHIKTQAGTRDKPPCLVRELAQGCLKDLSREDLNSEKPYCLDKAQKAVILHLPAFL